MASLSSRIVALIEKHVGLRPLEKHIPQRQDGLPCRPITIAVLGGGLAGPAFVRRVLVLASELGADIRVELLTRPSCNYCAGLITDVSLQSMLNVFGLPVPPNVIKESIAEVVYINPAGKVNLQLERPLTSVLRTSRFKQQGFDESWVDSVFEGFRDVSSVNVRRNARVMDVDRLDAGRGFRIRFEQDGDVLSIDADVAVIATGLKSLQQPFMHKLIADLRYRPPELMDASVTEVNTTKATTYALGGRMLVADGIIPHCLVAFVPKGKGWLTITGLGKVLADHDLELLFSHPIVKQYIELDQVIDELRCRRICSASVVTKAASGFYGDGWVMIGDLTGYGRALKDGYFAALQSADLAARTILLHGCSEAAFRRHYFRPLRKLKLDNQVGMQLYRLNDKVTSRISGYLLLKSALRETSREKYGGLTTGALRALFSGELSYKAISALFVAGIGVHLLTAGLVRASEPRKDSAEGASDASSRGR